MAIKSKALTQGLAGGIVPPGAALAIPTNIDVITDSTTGTAATTFVPVTAVGGSGATTAQEGVIDDNFASVAAELAIQRTFNTALVTALQSAGITLPS